mgnify:CR=1 FL=1
MKLSRIAVATLLAASPLVAANAGVTVTPLLLGYTFQDTQHNNGNDHLLSSNQGEAQDDLAVGAALGVELTPWLSFEAEYLQVKGDVDGVTGAPGAEYKQKQINGNFIATSDLITKNYDSKIKPYVLVGAGHYKYDFTDVTRPNRGNSEAGTLANAGVGAFWRLNDALSLRTEARATYNIDEDFWNYTALAGLNVVIGGHLKPAAPVVDVQPVTPPPVVEPQPQPQQLTEDLNMELRVFFDTNKSNIKPNFYATLNKVAKTLTEDNKSGILVTGYTDSTGTDSINIPLSQARAQSVASYLAAQGVSTTRINAQGQGAANPIASNATPAGREQNRRVEISIYAIQ